MKPTDDWRESLQRISEQLERTNALLAEQNRRISNWRFSFRTGLLIGLGSVLGATLLVSLLAFVLRPFTNLEFIRPHIERVIQDLERDNPRNPR